MGTHHRASTLAPLTSRETGILRTKGFDTESGVQQVLAKPLPLSLSLSLSLLSSLLFSLSLYFPLSSFLSLSLLSTLSTLSLSTLYSPFSIL